MIKRIYVEINHTFDLDIPDELLDEDSWGLEDYIFDAFTDEDWNDVDFDIRDIKENN